MTKERKRFEQWWDAEDDIPNDGPYTPDTPIQFAWAGWQAALAQSEQEPVAWFSTLPDGRLSIKIVGKPTEGNWEPLYTTPPQRTWVGLTDDEIQTTWNSVMDGAVFTRREVYKAIEAKLKEKNT